MHDDEVMDRLLMEAMAADVPQLSRSFDARVMTRARPRRLSTLRRVVMAVYLVASVAATVWVLEDVPAASLVVAAFTGLPVAAAATAYGRRLADVL
jgi:hypothetical protein